MLGAKAYLPPLLQMREIWCQNYSEPNAGSDLIVPRATKGGSSGGERRKIWASGAPNARAACCSPVRRRGDRIAALPVRAWMPGVTVRPLRQMDGREHFAEVFIDDVVIGRGRAGCGSGLVSGGARAGDRACHQSQHRAALRTS
jgi:alkylation response protein AidB-like acyl-CoA dehydrogenase